MRLPSKGMALGSIMFARRGSFITLALTPVAVRTALEDDVREDHRLVVLQLHALRERRPLARLHVVRNGLDVEERTMLAPDLSALLAMRR